MRRWLTYLVVLLTGVCSLGAQPASLPDSVSVGFVTCYPGPEIFELYGHEAVHLSGRLDGQPVDLIVNYGLFDFDSPGFVSRFVKGQTDYETGVVPTAIFLYPYRQRGSKVVERVLPLSAAEASELAHALLNDAKPENSTYRYKYFSANCATKPIEHLNRITDNRFAPTAAGEPLTYRQLLRQYNEGYPWYQLGIDIVLGTPTDCSVTAAQATFIPLELDRRYFGALPANELVRGERDGNRRGAPTPWFFSPLFLFWTLFAIVLLYFLRVLYRVFTEGKPGRGMVLRMKCLVSIWTLIQGLAGLLVWYLSFCSEHEGTSGNLNAIWLNPLWLAISVTVWIPACGWVTRFLMFADALVTGVLLCLWPLLGQALNPAVVPLMLITVLVGVIGLLRDSTDRA